jgi:hypothetical protein
MNSASALTFGDAADRQIVAFGGAAGEHDFVGVGANRSRDGFAGDIDGVACLMSKSVNAMWVAKLLGEVRQHGLDDARVDACRGVVVHVNGAIRIEH